MGRFLEHSRIFYFRNGGQEGVYLGSADLMGRNLNHRVEIMFPVESKRLIARVRDEILAACLDDNRNARLMRPDGSWVWEKTGEPALDSQAHFLIPSRPT